MTARWLWVALAWTFMSMAATVHADVQGPEWERVQRVGPPRMYSPSVARYRYGHTNVNNPEFYPIPQESVTRESYLRCIEETRPGGYRTPAQAWHGWATRFHAGSGKVRADRRSHVG